MLLITGNPGGSKLLAIFNQIPTSYVTYTHFIFLFHELHVLEDVFTEKAY